MCSEGKRRNIVVLCDDIECKFKQTNRGLNKQAQECALDTPDAIEFLKKYGFTTCEVGMGEKCVHANHIDNTRVIMKLKYKGRL